ncbi:MAG: glycoside hydrolase, partial [Clostridia bacterium]|nr:glycoside hydrolase [Clostridia bacterium]
IFRSDDDGKTWHYLTDLYPCFWGRMFIHNGEVYMLACSTEYGDLLIGKSSDGGKTFGTPTVLLRGSCKCDVAGVHKNPQPPLIYKGRLYTTLEWGSWGEGYHAAMVGSAPADADLLSAANWAFTDPVPYNPEWKGVAKGDSYGNIEGTLTVLPDGNLYNVMRYDMTRCEPNFGLVLAYRVNSGEPEAPLTYSHAIRLPGNHSKFMIRKDEKTGFYYTVIDRITDPALPRDRRLLSLMRSPDAEQWETVSDLMDFRGEDPEKTGFQYVDFFMEGETLYFLCRTAMNDPINFHDSNYSTFHKVENFRSL